MEQRRMMTRIPFETYMRAAAVQMLTDYAQDTSTTLQIYPGRPLTVNPPTAFIESMSEDITWSPGLRQRTVRIEIRIVWGLFDSAEAVAQRDYFIDNFVDWVSDRPHEAWGTTVIEPRVITDDPNFVADWMPVERQKSLFASTLTLEGFAGGY
jgi:hypothetical protein